MEDSGQNFITYTIKPVAPNFVLIFLLVIGSILLPAVIFSGAYALFQGICSTKLITCGITLNSRVIVISTVASIIFSMVFFSSFVKTKILKHAGNNENVIKRVTFLTKFVEGLFGLALSFITFIIISAIASSVT